MTVRFLFLLVTLVLPCLARALDLSAAFASLESQCRCRLGVSGKVVESGLEYSYRSHEFFPTASTYKLPIAAAFLSEVDAGRKQLDEKLRVVPSDIVRHASPLAEAHPQGGLFPARELITGSITLSDNTAADVILRYAGGPAAVNSFLRANGIEGMNIASSEKEMARRFLDNRTTPKAMTDLLVNLQKGQLLKAKNTSFLLETLQETKTFNGRLRGLLPKGTPVGHKTGSGGRAGGVSLATNDVGLITLKDGRHLAISVYLQNCPLSGDAADRIIAQVARTAFDAVQ